MEGLLFLDEDLNPTPRWGDLHLEKDEKRFLALVYEMNSPFVARHTDVPTRKKAVARHLNIEPSEQLLTLNEGRFVEGVIRIGRASRSRTWRLINVHESLFAEYERRLLEQVEEERDKDSIQAIRNKSAIATELRKVSSALDKLYRELAGGDDPEKLEAALADTGFTPSEYVK